MLRTRFVNCWLLILLLCLGSLFLAAPSVSYAEDVCSNGEPTDPEGALRMLETVNIEDFGLRREAPKDDADWKDWFQSLIDLIYQLGLIGGKG